MQPALHSKETNPKSNEEHNVNMEKHDVDLKTDATLQIASRVLNDSFQLTVAEIDNNLIHPHNPQRQLRRIAFSSLHTNNPDKTRV